MSKQAMYITQAHLLLAGLAAGFWLFSKISLTTSANNNGDVYNSVPQTENTVNLSAEAMKGKTLFLGKCASCHAIFKDMTGPGLKGFESRGPWSDRKQLYTWIRNPEKFMKDDPYTSQLKKQYGVIMTAFPTITDEEIDFIVEYINAATAQKPVP